ncbi:MAG: N-acetylneuraminate synthase family protein [Parcubacteria group bacterium]
MNFKIGTKNISNDSPSYFIADIASNHDGDLNRAKDLISLAREVGADGVKFQHFQADKIVSRQGFEKLGAQLSHQGKWPKSVYEMYLDASIAREWTEELKKHCNHECIDFFSSPYDMEAIEHLDPYVSVYKVGSGDITWPEILQAMAQKGKPMILSTGASDLIDVQRAVDVIYPINRQLAILQCNTNYTGNKDNFKYVCLNVLKTYKRLYPEFVIGLSDHTPELTTVLGAIALGARIIEKHFTDDNSRIGPDHAFSLNPTAWKEMVLRARELELALGKSTKVVEENEKDTVVLQRRCLRATAQLEPGDVITRDKISVLRPAPAGAVMPYDMQKIIGLTIKRQMEAGEEFTWDLFK